ncbi:MAG: hypothetical protein HOG49_15835, partial [Candidatus Scalindua sp.]|nr:hypothetical protein [Candidatus Scalindua sp.]
MRKQGFFITFLVITLFFIGSAQARKIESKSEKMVRSAKASGLFKSEFRPSEIQSRGLTKVKLQNGINLDLKKYLDSSRLKNDDNLRPLFTDNIQQRFLTKAPQYSEKIIQLSDRLVINRKLVIKLKPGVSKQGNLPSAINSFYFHRKKGEIPPDVAIGLKDMRKKLKNAPPKRIVMGNITAAQARRMSDADLLGLALSDNERVIQHVSVLPLQGFKRKPGIKLKNPKNRGLTNFEKKLAKNKTPLKLVAKLPIMTMQPIDLESVTMSPLQIWESLSEMGKWEFAMCWEEIVRFAQGKGERGDEWGDEWDAMLGRGALSSDQNFDYRTWEEARELLLRIKRTGQTACTDRMLERLEEERVGRRKAMESKKRSFPKKKFTTGFLYERSISNSYSYTFAGETWFTDRYYIEVYYDIGYNFGFRFPYSVEVDASPMRVKGSGIPKKRYRRFKVKVKPLNLEGDEFTAWVWAEAGFKASIPGPNYSKKFGGRVGSGKSFKPLLGKASKDSVSKTVWLKGRETEPKIGFDAWVGGVYLDIGVTAKMKEGEIGYNIKPDSNSRFTGPTQSEREVWRSNTKNYPFFIEPRNINEHVGFKIDKPRYKFGIKLMPSLRINLNIDLGIWGTNRNIGPLQLDSLSVDTQWLLKK